MIRRWSHIGGSACWKRCLEGTSPIRLLLRSSVVRPQQQRLVPSNFSSCNFYYQQRQYHHQQQRTMSATSTSTTLPPPKKDDDHNFCCYVFDPPIIPSLPVLESGRIFVDKGDQPQDDQKQQQQQQQQQQPSSTLVQFPIHRIYCVGKNYEDHIVEMGGTVVERNKSVNSGSPVFFTKPVVDGVVVCSCPPPPHDSHNDDGGDDGGSQKKLQQQQQVVVPYPSHTTNLHYEVELVVAIGRDAAAVVTTDNNNSGYYNNNEISIDEAHNYIYGFGVGVDLTRRDLQHTSKQRGLPWDTAKYFDHSCPLGPISSIIVDKENDDDDDGCHCLKILQHLQTTARIELEVNGRIVQQAPIGSMIWNIVEIISELSKLYRLRKGDVILTGTPSGVGPLQIGDHVIGRIVFDDGEKDNDHSTLSSSFDDDHQMEQRFQIQPVEFVMT